MVSCACCNGGGADDEKLRTQPFQKGGAKDLSEGPVKNRGCTDSLCLLIYLVWWGVFAFVTFLGLSDGNPSRLYFPRDHRGDYCGVAVQWNDDLDLEDFVKQTYVMNVTETVNDIAAQLVCSSIAEYELRTILSASELEGYRCACCKTPCEQCWGSLQLPDISSLGAVSVSIVPKLQDLSHANINSLFSPDGLVQASNIFGSAHAYFIATCAKECNHGLTSQTRFYTYDPPPDVAWHPYWNHLKTDQRISDKIRNLIASQFTFPALPYSECPYPDRYCVPFPGVNFKELEGNYCTFSMSADVLEAVGDAAATAFEELGGNEIADQVAESFGEAFGDLLRTIDAFVIVCICALIVGFIYLVLLRFLVGCVVWSGLIIVFMIFLAAGGLAMIRSSQCAGAGLFETGETMGNAIVGSAVSVATAVASGDELGDESVTGVKGDSYRGRQTQTRSGRQCQRWDHQSPHDHSFNSRTHPDNGLTGNYCRNPSGAPTIWCFTQDPGVRWETCQPIGVIRPECPHGHEVPDETQRKVLEICSYISWALSVLWILFICCLCSRIRLAIAVNKVAAQFIYTTPQILLVPLVQIFMGICWILIWIFCASFLLSQVPDGYTPKDSYATYAEAVDKCEGGWPAQGFVWKDEHSCTQTASGTPQCWRCAPPRYVLDLRFALSFFTLLWNNALLIALGQIIIAGACGVWFFASHDSKKHVSSVRKSLRNTFCYHFGTVALGSFIIALVQMIRYCLKYIEKRYSASQNKVVKCLLKAMQYCLWCFEKCLKFLNKNAYIQTALMGTNFCTSAKNAFYLIVRNALRFAVVATLGGILHFLGFIFIMVATTVLGYFILAELHSEVTPVAPILAYVAISYLVAKLYMNVFGLSVDSMLQCFIATEEMGGCAGYVPATLSAFVPDKAPDQKPGFEVAAA